MLRYARVFMKICFKKKIWEVLGSNHVVVILLSSHCNTHSKGGWLHITIGIIMWSLVLVSKLVTTT
jgi:hypothetical protein